MYFISLAYTVNIEYIKVVDSFGLVQALQKYYFRYLLRKKSHPISVPSRSDTIQSTTKYKGLQKCITIPTMYISY